MRETKDNKGKARELGGAVTVYVVWVGDRFSLCSSNWPGTQRCLCPRSKACTTAPLHHYNYLLRLGLLKLHVWCRDFLLHV